MGSIPMIMAAAVMRTGRMRVLPAASAAERCVHAFEALIVGEDDHQDTVGGGHADAHDGAHQRRHAEGGLGDEEHPDDAGERAGQRHEDDEGVEPGLEVDGHQEVDEDDGEDEAEAEAIEGSLHGFDLAAQIHGTAAGQFLWYLAMIFSTCSPTLPRS